MFNLQLFKLFVVSEVSITHVHSYFGLTMFPSTQNQVRQTGRVNTVEKSQTNATNVTLPQHEPSEHPSIHPLRIHPSINPLRMRGKTVNSTSSAAAALEQPD